MANKLKVIEMEELHNDDRGIIQRLTEDEIYTVLYITSKAGAIRANHYHKEDWHYCFLLTGSMEYFERDIGDDQETHKIIVKAGQGIYTGSKVYHAVRFLESSSMITLSPRQRDEFNYEEDLVRYELIQ